MRYRKVRKGEFLLRPNRFIAHVEIDGRTEICHVKNTGRCRELLIPGAEVYLEQAENPSRKTQYDLIAVRKGDILINMDAQAPNKVFGEWVADGGFLPGVTAIRPEFTWEDSRFDFRLETEQGIHFVEVKGVTLEENGEVCFPDAPTERGTKHLNGLLRAVELGYGATVCFVVQMKGARVFRPNDRTDPAFGQALRRAAAGGVNVLAVDCRVEPDFLEIHGPIPIDLSLACTEVPHKADNKE